MSNCFFNKMFYDTCNTMGMNKNKNGLHDCGLTMIGDKKTTNGYLWFFIYEDYFAISHCDFTFIKNCQLEMPANTKYISLRLDKANHLPPGKIISFMEEVGHGTHTIMKSGSRVSYTEILYSSDFYNNHINGCFSNLKDNPIEFLKNMGGEHNWPVEMMNILVDIRTCKLSGASAKLFFVAKAYEMMSALIAMGDTRKLRNETDYEGILSVIQHINTTLPHEIKQHELVKVSYMSPTKLKQLFKKFTGKTITEYIIDKKIDKACHILLETNSSIEEIARNIGFATPTGFATSFKKQTGIPPSKYREQMAFNCTKDPSQIKDISFST